MRGRKSGGRLVRESFESRCERGEGLSPADIAASHASGSCHNKCPAPEVGTAWQNPRRRRQRWRLLRAVVRRAKQGRGRVWISPGSTVGSLHFLGGDESPLPNPRLNGWVGNTSSCRGRDRVPHTSCFHPHPNDVHEALSSRTAVESSAFHPNSLLISNKGLLRRKQILENSADSGWGSWTQKARR